MNDQYSDASELGQEELAVVVDSGAEERRQTVPDKQRYWSAEVACADAG